MLNVSQIILFCEINITILHGCENKIIINSGQPRVCVKNHSNTLP